MSFLLLWSAAVIKHSYIDSLDAVPALEAASASASATATAGSVAAGQADLLTAPPIAADGLTMPGAAAGAAPDAGVSSSSSGLQAYMSSLWQDVYQVLVLSFGENFPSARGERFPCPVVVPTAADCCSAVLANHWQRAATGRQVHPLVRAFCTLVDHLCDFRV
jgi:hypothetical protein